MGIFTATPGQPVQGADPNFTSASVPRFTTFKFKDLPPAVAIYIEAADVLNLRCAARLVGEVVQFNWRFLGIDGQISVGQQQLTIATAFVSVASAFQLGEGFLLSLSATCTTTTLRGDCYVECGISRGFVPPGISTQAFVSDFVTNKQPTVFPGGRVISGPEGIGAPYVQTVANPAAGADWIFTVPVGQRIRIISLQAQLVTSATVANRNTQIGLFSSGGINVMFAGAANASIPASTTAQVVGANMGSPSTVITTTVYCQLPASVTLGGGFRIQTSTVGLQAGDQWSNIALLLESWVELQ